MQNLSSDKCERNWLDDVHEVQNTPLLFSPAIPSTNQPNHLSFTTSRRAKMSHTNSFNTNSYNNVLNYNTYDERSQILTWLSPLEPRLRHHDIQDRRVDDVGEWLLTTDSVRNRPGARRGPAGGLPRAPDGTGRLAVVRPVLPKGRTAVFGWTAGDSASDLSWCYNDSFGDQWHQL